MSLESILRDGAQILTLDVAVRPLAGLALWYQHVCRVAEVCTYGTIEPSRTMHN